MKSIRISSAIHCLCVLVILSRRIASYSYDESSKNGPTNWHKKAPNCSVDYIPQSPIDIDTNIAVGKSYTPLSIKPNTLNEMNVKIVDYTLQLDLVKLKDAPVITGGPLDVSKYKFWQLHFHWHSETRIDGKIYPLEMHMVFFDTKFTSFTEAASSGESDALLVLAVFAETGPHANPIFSFTTKFRETGKFSEPTTHVFDGKHFTELMPPTINKYYTFDGSLTTPPCSSVTKWIVFQDHLTISEEQMSDFKKLRDIHGNVISHNVRPLQELGLREIYFNKNGEKKD